MRKKELSFYNLVYYFVDKIKDPLIALNKLATLTDVHQNNINTIYNKIAKFRKPTNYEQYLWYEGLTLSKRKISGFPMSRNQYYAIKKGVELGQVDPQYQDPILSEYEATVCVQFIKKILYWIDVFGELFIKKLGDDLW